VGGRSQWRSGAGEDLGVYSSNNVNGLQGLSLFSGPEGIELLSLQSKEGGRKRNRQTNYC